MQMDYDGLVVPYPVNRPLTDEERRRRLDVNVRLAAAPCDAGTVIRLSETELELVDKYFAWKGAATLFVLPLLVMFVSGLSWSTWELASTHATLPPEKTAGAVFFVCVVVVLGLPTVGLLAWLLMKEVLVLTHYPMRLKRPGGWVHVHRPGRSSDVLRVRWKDVFWHVRHTRHKQFGGYSWCIAGHVMRDDGRTVRETFSFGCAGASPEELHPLWEYVRRFMEEPSDAVPTARVNLPIDGRREGFWWGAQTLLFTAPGHPALTFLLLPALAPAAIVRWLCMLTNRVPTWPEELETARSSMASPRRQPIDRARPWYVPVATALAVGLIIDGLLLSWWWLAS